MRHCFAEMTDNLRLTDVAGAQGLWCILPVFKLTSCRLDCQALERGIYVLTHTDCTRQALIFSWAQKLGIRILELPLLRRLVQVSSVPARKNKSR